MQQTRDTISTNSTGFFVTPEVYGLNIKQETVKVLSGELYMIYQCTAYNYQYMYATTEIYYAVEVI